MPKSSSSKTTIDLNLSLAELQKEWRSLRDQLVHLRVAISLQKEKDLSKVKKTRKQIARILTAIKEKGA